MKHEDVSRGTKATAGSTAGLDLLERLESEIAALREKNAHLQRRLEEVEMDAELQVRADRILAISPPMDA